MQFLYLLALYSIAAVAPSQASTSSERNWDEPASLQDTTDAEGNHITKTLWWVPPTTTSVNPQNSPATIVTSSNAEGEYTSTIWWLPPTSSRQDSISNSPKTTVITGKHGKKSTSTISDSPSSLASSTSKTNEESSSANGTVPVQSNAGGKIEDMYYGISAIALAYLLI